jgi:Na+-driven multidrug efflux pump
MNFKKVLISFVIGFAITLIVSSLVTYLYSLGFHETAKIDWETSFQLAIIFGIVFPIMEARKGKPKDK